MKNILLIGAEFKNKGAEAMALTAVVRFSQLYPNCSITIASVVHNEDLPYGIHTLTLPYGETFRFDFIRNRIRRSQIVRVFLFRLIPFPKIRSLILKGDLYLQRFAASDLIVDLSGFAMSDQQPLKRRLVFCFQIFTSWCLNKSHIIFTQALGPFEKLSSWFLAKLFLPRVDLLIARGQKTYKHLKKIGLSQKMNIPICADSAFLFTPAPYEIADKILNKHGALNKPLFGIIPNINIFRRTEPGDDGNLYIQFLVSVCDYVQSTLEATAIFICHEGYHEGQRDDEWLAYQVIRQTKNPHPIAVIPANHSAAELKAIIGRLEFVLASRFHSIVAAISVATPFLIVGWAHKYRELVADLNMEDSVFDVWNLSREDFFKTLQKAWSSREVIRKHLEEQYPKLRFSADRAFQIVCEKWPDI